MDIKQKIRTMVALCAAFALAVGVATATAGNGGTSQKKHTPPPPRGGSSFDCQVLLAGTYTTAVPLWKCLGVYSPDQAHETAANSLLYADCTAEGGTGFYGVGTTPGTTDYWCARLT